MERKTAKELHNVRQLVTAAQNMTLQSGEMKSPTGRAPVNVNEDVIRANVRLPIWPRLKEECSVSLRGPVQRVCLVIKLRAPYNQLVVHTSCNNC